MQQDEMVDILKEAYCSCHSGPAMVPKITSPEISEPESSSATNETAVKQTKKTNSKR